jgi:hypothetical protein
VIGYEEDANHKAITFEQSYAAHHYKFSKAVDSSLKIVTISSEGEDNDSDILGLTVVYAGFPSDVEKSVFHGSVSSYSKNQLLMQSFALPGASGSVIFDNKGRVVGVLSAVKLGFYEFSVAPQIHPGLVQVMRLRDYDRRRIKEIIVQWKDSN